jgi:hypothetical protein
MSSLYDIGRRGFLTSVNVGAWDGQIDWEADDFVVALVTQAYADVPSFLSAHTSEADLLLDPDYVVATTPLVGNTSNASGVASATNTVFSAVVGDEVVAVVIYRDNGTVAADNVLVAYIDSAISGLPVVPNNGDITILWNGGSDGAIFRL